MRKRISLKTRRSDRTVAEFRDHYETRHVPLGLRFIDRFQWRRYVRNHVLSVEGTPVSFDCYTEFWVDDGTDDRELERFIASDAFRVLDEDDRRFLDIERRFSGELREESIATAGAERPVVSKRALLWRTGPGQEEHELARSVAHEIVASLGDRVVGATLDRLVGEPAPDPPFDTLLTLELADAEAVALPAGPTTRWSLLTVDPVETPASLLYGA